MLKTRNLMLIAFTLIFILISIGFIAAADYHDSIPVTTDDGGSIIIDPNSCQEDWSGSTWSQCLNGQQTFICFDKNMCGTDDLKPSLCGEVQECGGEDTTTTTTTTTSSGGGGGGSSGGGGGGSSTYTPSTGTGDSGGGCVENWVCQAWSNSDQSCGTRTCEDINKCGTTLLKPRTSESCPSFSWITGAITGFTGFAKSNPVSLVFIILIVAGIVLFFGTKKSKKRKVI